MELPPGSGADEAFGGGGGCGNTRGAAEAEAEAAEAEAEAEAEAHTRSSVVQFIDERNESRTIPGRACPYTIRHPPLLGGYLNKSTFRGMSWVLFFAQLLSYAVCPLRS